MEDITKQDNITDVDNIQSTGLTAGGESAVAEDTRTPFEQATSTGEDVSFGEGVADVGMGVVRGGLAFGQSLYNLADTLSFDHLPDIDMRSVAGENKTLGGTLAEGITQFMLGFVPVAGQIGRAGALANAGTKVGKFGKFLTVADKSGKLSKAKLNWKGDMVAGSVSDFISFSGQEARLSNIVQQYPDLANPVTQYLSYEEGDGELEGRLKNSIEGILAEVGISVVMKQGFLKSLNILRQARKEMPVDGDVASVVDIEGVGNTADEVVKGADEGFQSNVIKEDPKFKSDIWEPEDTPEGYKDMPFTPLRDKPNQDIGASRGVDAIMDRLNTEAKRGKLGVTKDEVKEMQMFFDEFGDEPFKDVALSFTKRLDDAALFDFTKSVAEIGNRVVAEGNLTPTMFHELWHAGSRSLGEKDISLVKNAYTKSRKAYEKKNPWFRDVSKLTNAFSIRAVSKADLDNLVKKHGEGVLDNFNVGKDGNGRFKFTDENYRYQEVDEWFAEQMKDGALGRLSKDFAPTGTLKSIYEGLIEFAKAMINKVKAKAGGDPTEYLLDQFKQRKLAAIKSNGTIGGDIFDQGMRKLDLEGKASEVEEILENNFLTHKNQKAKRIGEKITKGDLTEAKTQRKKNLTHVNTSTPKAVMSLVDGAIKTLNKEAVRNSIKPFADMNHQGAYMLDDILSDSDKYGTDLIDKFLTKGNDLKANEMESFTFAVRQVQNVIVDDVVKLTPDLLKGVEQGSDKFTQIAAELKANLTDFANLEAINSELVASRAGRALNAQRKAAMNSAQIINVTPEQILEKGSKMEFLQNMGNFDIKDIQDFSKLVDQFKEEMIVNPEIMTKLVRGLTMKQVADKVHTYWINALLSGVKGFSTNLASAGLHSTMRSMYTRIGASMSGRDDIFKAMSQMQIQFSSDINMLNTFKSTFKKGGSDFEGSRGMSSFDENPNTLGTSWIMDKIQTPTKALLSADAMMKQQEFLKQAKLKATIDAIDIHKLKDPEAIEKHVQHTIDSIMTDGGRINNPDTMKMEMVDKLKESGEWDRLSDSDKRLKMNEAEAASFNRLGGKEGIRDYALDNADKTLFMNDADGWAGKLQVWLKSAPAGVRWIVPFTKTPINVINSGLSLAFSPAAWAGGKVASKFDRLHEVRDKLLKDFNSPDPQIAAEAKGKLAVSSSMWFGIMAIAQSNPDRITGGGSSDPAERKRMEDAGWQKYSIKVGDKYYSYQRLDPLAMILGLASDVNEATNDPSRQTDEIHESAYGIALTALSQNILDKSFLTGVDSFIKAMNSEERMTAWVRNTAASFIPTIIPQSAEVLTGSPMSNEVWTFTDALSKRSLLGSGGLDKKRNILGEEVSSQDLNLSISRMFDLVANVSEDKDDIVLEEIASLRQGFDIPSKLIAGNINLTEFDMDDGRTSYDYYRRMHGEVKIGGKTLRQALTKTINSNWYQKLDPNSMVGFQSKRISELQKIIRMYRSEALKETLDANPELDMIYHQTKTLRGRQVGGDAILGDVTELINTYQ